jgi:hypothetical protein
MGASSGIGRATALRFAEQGAAVVVAARGEPGLRSLIAEIEEAGGTAPAVVADVADPTQVAAVADHAVATYGRLDTCTSLRAVVDGEWGVEVVGRVDRLGLAVVGELVADRRSTASASRGANFSSVIRVLAAPPTTRSPPRERSAHQADNNEGETRQ